MSDDMVFSGLIVARFSNIDYYRIACQLLFQCYRCGNCCTTGNPIRLRFQDISLLAKHLKIPLNKTIKKFTVPDTDKPEAFDFKNVQPCKFYNQARKECKIYSVRPWSCRIFPFLGIYGSEDHIKINESCAGSVATMIELTKTLEEATAEKIHQIDFDDIETVRAAKQFFRAFLEEFAEK